MKKVIASIVGIVLAGAALLVGAPATAATPEPRGVVSAHYLYGDYPDPDNTWYVYNDTGSAVTVNIYSFDGEPQYGPTNVVIEPGGTYVLNTLDRTADEVFYVIDAVTHDTLATARASLYDLKPYDKNRYVNILTGEVVSKGRI